MTRSIVDDKVQASFVSAKCRDEVEKFKDLLPVSICGL